MDELRKPAAAAPGISRREFIQSTWSAGMVASSWTGSFKAPSRHQVILNGQWMLYFDRSGRWQKKDWIKDFLAPTPRPFSIPWEAMRKEMESEAIAFPVPATWEEFHPNTTGEAWYWKDLTIPREEGPRAFRLVFNAVRYGAEVFLEGRRIAIYLGGFTPFEADLTSWVQPARSYSLAMHVVNPGGGEAGNWDKLFFENVQIPQSHNFGGIWQDVTLQVTSPVFIDDIFVEPLLEKQVARAHLRVRNHTNRAQPLRLHAEAQLESSPGKVAGRVMREVEVPVQSGLSVVLDLRLDPVVLWEPARPERYQLQVRLEGSKPLLQDAYQVSFGMREFTVKGRHFYLNGRRFLIKSAINHQYYPVTVGYPPAGEFARREVEAALKSGLNMMHLHRQIGHPDLLEWADRLGLLLYEESGGAIFDRSHGLNYPGIQLLGRQLADLVVRDRNHPALVAWGLSNENVLNPWVYAHLMQMVRRLDPTRMICDNSGHGLNMLHPFETRESPWRDLHFYPPVPVQAATYDALQDMGRPPNYSFRLPNGRELLPPLKQEAPVVVGEIGYGGLPDIPVAVEEFIRTGKPGVEGRAWKHALENLERGFRHYNLQPDFGSVRGFCEATEEVHAEGLVDLIQALRTNPANSGYAVSTFHDMAAWFCGITDIFRNCKLSSARLAQTNRPLFLALYALPCPTWTDHPTYLSCTVVNESGLSGPAQLVMSVVNPHAERIYYEEIHQSLDSQRHLISPPVKRSIRLEGGSGYYTFQVDLRRGQEPLAFNRRRIFAIHPADVRWPSRPLLLYDLHQQLLPFFARSSVPHDCWSSSLPRSRRSILVGEINRWYYLEHREAVDRAFGALFEECRQGSIAIFLLGSIGGDDDGLIEVLNRLRRNERPLQFVPTAGNFRGCFHFVKSHPFFNGLPTKCCMGREYQNVVADRSLDGFEGETVVGCNQNAFWWGTDIGILRIGSGAWVLSTMRLPHHLGSDPVAERLLANMACWEPR
jgi:beta-galactosidase